MQREYIIELQTKLKDIGYYLGEVDGIAGDKTKAALNAMLEATKSCAIDCKTATKPLSEKIYYGSKVSPTFKDRVLWMRDALEMPKDGANWIMTCMGFETMFTFRPDIKNAAGSSGTGLIQFMRATAISMGTTVEKLAAMTAEDQLNWVYKYFLPYKGKLKTLGDVYFAILYPKAIGKADAWVLWEKGTLSYTQNSGLDRNKDGKISRSEVLTAINHAYSEGKKYEA